MTPTTIFGAVTASFLASFVEFVEAFTIVLAVGIARGWRPAALGSGLALAFLAVLIALLGPALAYVPLHALQWLVGALLILFGMRWLHKSILRMRGVVAFHDEAKVFLEETHELQAQARDRRGDYLAAVAAFKGVTLEGLEVVFIVIAVGAARGLTMFAALGAGIAMLVVALIGLAVHRPLTRVPENAFKFVVGSMLTTFGIFWMGEGLGAGWPGSDLSLIGLFLILVASGLAIARMPKAAVWSGRGGS
jgi:uncharacterized membrane protein